MMQDRKDYPRPQLMRSAWQNLNGEWDFAFDEENRGVRENWQNGIPKQKKIQVPFSYETKASGIGDAAQHEVVWYQRNFSFAKKEGKRSLLHFEGADFLTEVWVNGKAAGKHTGAYSRFSFDVTALLQEGENSLVVRCQDSMSVEIPRGKQRWMRENYACWYVQTTGIWKTVWMEEVPEIYIGEVKLTPEIASGELQIEAKIVDEGSDEREEKPRELLLLSEVFFDGKKIGSVETAIHLGRVTQRLSVLREDLFEWGLHLWTPESPALYDLKLTLMEQTSDEKSALDEVVSYFGMREIRIDHGNILLNNVPLYQRLILDQGYFKESGLTPPSVDALVLDIDRVKEMGFNGVRKHMKVEDERFLYLADVKGLLVWSEMAAHYRFSDAAVQEYTKEWMEVLRQNYNHPSIITWTPFNESWGIPQVETERRQQHYTEAIYHLTKAFDPMRPVISNDGWEHTVSDIITLHDYEEDGERFLNRYLTHKEEILRTQLYHCGHKSAMANGYTYEGQPVILSEYGGIAFADKQQGEWGYGNAVKSEEEFLLRLQKITAAIYQVPYIVGFCYTQVSDVEQEVNGLMRENRTYKVDPQKIRPIIDPGAS